jgi:hypothetical protein
MGRHFFEQYEKRGLEGHGPLFFAELVGASTSDDLIS